jgi:hypothetical protein
MGISNSAMLVEMNISVWGASKIDRNVTSKAIDDNLASKDAGKFHKNLMSGTTLRRDIELYATQCRQWHLSKTLPWSDKGPRLLPTSLFLDYKKEVNVRRDTMMGMVTKFVQEYPNLMNIAQHTNQGLGLMFNSSEYPPADQIAAKFGFNVVFGPVPTSGDFRIDMPQEAIEELSKQYDVAVEERVAAAVQQSWDQLHKMLSRMSERLSLTDEENKKTKWHDTFVTNAQDLCDLLTHLNVTNDPKLEEARRALERTMIGADIDHIKKSSDVRTDMKNQVDAIIKKFEW